MKSALVVRTSILLILIVICAFLTFSTFPWNSLERKVYGHYKAMSLPNFILEMPANPSPALSIDSGTTESVKSVSEPARVLTGVDVVPRSQHAHNDSLTASEQSPGGQVVESVAERPERHESETSHPKEAEQNQNQPQASVPLLADVGLNLQNQIRPGMTILLTGLYEGGTLVLELLESSISSELQERFRIKSGASAIHLHARLGSKPAVANSAAPGDVWQNEIKIEDPFLDQKNIPLLCKFMFAEEHIKISCNDKPVTDFQYRYNPFKIAQLRFSCRASSNCLRDASARYTFAPSPSDCFKGFCKEPTQTPLDTEADLPTGIKHSYFINLAHRQDRRDAIEGLLSRASIPFERLEAVNPRTDPNSAEMLSGCYDNVRCPGQVGCQYSHLKALKQAIDRGLEHIAIFEDDFTFQPWVDPAAVQRAVAGTMLLIPDWDVIALSLNIGAETVMPGYEVSFSAAPAGGARAVGLTRIHNAQTTGGYIVRRRMMQKIYDSWLPENCHVKKDYPTAIDQCWKPLQANHVWVAFEPQPGTQAKSFSDIENAHVDYGLTRRR